MLHSLPALLETLEQHLMQGNDPLALLATVRWSEIVDWPKDPDEAKRIQKRVASIHSLITGLQAPIQAAFGAVGRGLNYGAAGRLSTPDAVSVHLSEHV